MKKKNHNYVWQPMLISCGDHFAMYTNINSLRCVPNVLYDNYMPVFLSVKKPNLSRRLLEKNSSEEPL